MVNTEQRHDPCSNTMLIITRSTWNGNLLKDFLSDRSLLLEVRLKWQMDILEVCENGSEPLEQKTLCNDEIQLANHKFS
jgi:hypothetical protein